MLPETWAIVLAGMMALTFGANELSHGTMAEAAGFAHHHAVDHGGDHCLDHAADQRPTAQAHGAHVHGNASQVPHGACPGSAGMDPGRHMGGP